MSMDYGLRRRASVSERRLITRKVTLVDKLPASLHKDAGDCAEVPCLNARNKAGERQLSGVVNCCTTEWGVKRRDQKKPDGKTSGKADHGILANQFNVANNVREDQFKLNWF